MWICGLFGKDENMKTVRVKYTVVRAVATYNIIIGRPAMNALGAVTSSTHLCMKYPLEADRVGFVCTDQELARRYYKESLRVRRRMTDELLTTNHGVNLLDLDPWQDFADRRPSLRRTSRTFKQVPFVSR